MGWDVKKISYIAERNTVLQTYLKAIWVFIKKLKIHIPFYLPIPAPISILGF